ncbi:VPLPA-CTERM sorting domain-containing protein [Hyphococcus sp.]|uniref:VPLPA-CTERM sorting domain-containing protein n=1 Tax=Hyphococcus sp. TaxID=2038636 RepID=UPI003CCC2237
MKFQKLTAMLAIIFLSVPAAAAATLEGDEIFGTLNTPGAPFNIFDPAFTSPLPVSATVGAGPEFTVDDGFTRILADFSDDMLEISVEILDDSIIGIADLEYTFDDLDFGPGLQIVGFDVLSNGFPGMPIITTTANGLVISFEEYDVNGLELRSFTGQFIVSEVPLPAALPLFLAGLAGVGFAGRRRNKIAA